MRCTELTPSSLMSQSGPDVVPGTGAVVLAAALCARVPWLQLPVHRRPEAGRGQGGAGGRAHAPHRAHQPPPLPDSRARAERRLLPELPSQPRHPGNRANAIVTLLFCQKYSISHDTDPRYLNHHLRIPLLL